VFIDSGYEAISPPIIQKADIFLDVIGEVLRGRTYVFTDPEGEELCLRPDLTVPTCRYYLEKPDTGYDLRQYCYHGPAFRYQALGTASTHPREFSQAGIETFGTKLREHTDANTMAIILKAIKSLGLNDTTLRIGDIGIFRALIKAIDMPERWRQLLIRLFWKPISFRAELKRFTEPRSLTLQTIPQELQNSIDVHDLQRSEKAVIEYLSAKGFDPYGTRTVKEITQNLMWRLLDTKANPLSIEKATLIEKYLSIRGPVKQVQDELRKLLQTSGIDITATLDSFEMRLQFLSETGVDVSQIEFSAEFGRQMAYYTGFIFEIISPLLGFDSPIAGGGRYDDLLKAVGAKTNIPAVGGAIHTERLLKAMGE
ncbi:MAG: ATP phosphoribosyltransferase regulatory subunit, partial [Hyphomicrobium sp.]